MGAPTWHLGDKAAGEEAGSAAPPGEKPAGPLLPSVLTLQSVQRVAASTAGILKDVELQAKLPEPRSSDLGGGTRASAVNRVQVVLSWGLRPLSEAHLLMPASLPTQCRAWLGPQLARKTS